MAIMKSDDLSSCTKLSTVKRKACQPCTILSAIFTPGGLSDVGEVLILP